MEQADRHPEDDLLELERDKLRDELTQALWNKAVGLQRQLDVALEANSRLRQEVAEAGKLRNELTQAHEDAERDRNALELRLVEEILWGHQDCTSDNCKSSGRDCPAERL